MVVENVCTSYMQRREGEKTVEERGEGSLLSLQTHLAFLHSPSHPRRVKRERAAHVPVFLLPVWYNIKEKLCAAVKWKVHTSMQWLLIDPWNTNRYTRVRKSDERIEDERSGDVYKRDTILRARRIWLNDVYNQKAGKKEKRFGREHTFKDTRDTCGRERERGKRCTF